MIPVSVPIMSTPNGLRGLCGILALGGRLSVGNKEGG